MKKSMPEYLSALSDNNFEVLEEIIDEKFNEFRQLYWLISDYSDYITSLSYKERKNDSLKVDLTLTKLKIDKVMQQLSEAVQDDARVLIRNEKKVIHIEIRKK